MFEDKTIEIFSSRDMIRQQLITYAEEYLELSNIDLTKSSYLSYLINILSVLTSNLIYYNTAAYREFFLIRAHQKESVLNLAAMIGYKPDAATPATVQILITMPINFRSTTTVVMKGRHDPDHEAFKFYADDIVFSCENEIQIEVIMDRGRMLATNIIEINKKTGGTRGINWKLTEDGKNISFFVNAIQIEDQKTTFKFPPLRPFQYYTETVPFSGDFAGISVETVGMEEVLKEVWDAELQKFVNDRIDLVEDDVVYWEDRPSLFLINPGEYCYTYRVNEKNIKLFFGNNVIGTQPKEGHECTVSVETTRGFEGNVIAGSITQPGKLTALVEMNGLLTELPVQLKCINTSPAMGGKNYPTIDEIRSQAIVQVSTNKRLVTQYDFENASSVVRDLPIQHSLPVLKRSDLKRNEICLFTDIIFMNEYVPTKNAVIKVKTENIDYPIRFNDVVEIDYNRFENEEDYLGIEFVNMFDIQIDKNQKTCSYFYTLSKIEKEAILKKTYTDVKTIIFPSNVSFEVIKDPQSAKNDKLKIEFYFVKISDDELYNDLRCYVEINELGIFNPMEYKEIDDNGNLITFFSIEINLSDIPEGKLLFDFQIKYKELTVEKWICNCHAETVVKQKLHEFMYSKIRKFKPNSPESNNGQYWGIIYDVPVVLKDYIDELDKNKQMYNFIEQVLHRIVTFDMSEYRMITDYVNLKFSNTYGSITNMNHNKETKGIVNRIDPETMPYCPGDGYTCAVTNDTNVWNKEPWGKKEGGFLARYASNISGSWVFQDLKTNDILLYDYISPGEPYRPPQKPKNPKASEVGFTPKELLPKMIYNGDNLFFMPKSIPLSVDLEIWKNPSSSISDSGLIQMVKNNLIRHFISKMGYDKPIYVSDITTVVHNIPYVDYCRVLKPEHDIFFNYDFEQLKHEDLLRYSPQLVYLTSGLINVNIRKRSDLRG